jgi:O-antigen ligase/tetratricopeptide (TPR) repeat protein
MWVMYGNSQAKAATQLVIILALVAIVVLRHMYDKKSYWDLSVPLLIFISFVVYVGLLMLRMTLPQYGLDKFIDIISVLLVFLFIDSMIVNKEKMKLWENGFINVVLGLATLEFLLIIAWYAKWVALSGNLFPLPPIGYRLSGILWPSPNFVAGSLNLILPLVLIRFVQNNGSKRWVLGLLLILMGVIEYFSSSRAGWMAALFAIAVTLCLVYYPAIRESWRNRTRFSFSASKVLFAVALFALIPFVAYLFINQGQNTPGHFGLLSGRDEIWTMAWQIWSHDFLTGGGLGSFPLYFSQLNGGPGQWLAEHAHNMWLQIGAETGLLGVLFVLVALIWLIWAFWRAWIHLSQKPESRIQLAAYAGIAVGMVAHQQADYLFTIPLYMVFAVLLIALFSKIGDPSRIKIPNRSFYLVLATVLIAYAGGKVYGSGGSLNTFAPHEKRAIDTASLMCNSAAEAPQFTTFAFQCGALQGNLFYKGGNSANLQLAIQAISDGLERDPFWPVHWANLGILQWAGSQKESAISSMLVATEKAPYNSLFALNYGWMAENHNKSIVAQEAYKVAIEVDPWLLESPFFHETSLRKTLLEGVYGFLTSAEDMQNLEAYRAIRSEDLTTAEQRIGEALAINPKNPESLALLGIIEQKKGEVEDAAFHSAAAVFIDETSPLEERNPRVYVWASQIALAQGKPADAAGYIELAFSSWSGKRQYDSGSYYYFVYHRSTLVNSLVLGFRRADFIPEMVDAFQWLADYYQSQGMVTEKIEMQQKLAAEGIDFK